MAVHKSGSDLDERDLARTILTALTSGDPVSALRTRFGWMHPQLVLGFIERAVPLQNAGSGELEPEVERFAHTVRAYWLDSRASLLDLVGPLLVFAAGPAALLLAAVEIWR